MILTAGAHAVFGAPAAPSDPLVLGIAHYQGGNYAQALPHFLRAVELAPNDPQGWFWLGATYLKLNRTSDAVFALRRAIDLDPRNGQAYLFLGLAYLQLDRRDDARRAFELALQFAPTAEYAAAARQWLATLQAGGNSPLPAAPAACPVPPVVPASKAPPPVQDRRVRIEITIHDTELENGEVVVSGELENLSEAPVRDIRVQSTAYGLAGQQIAQAFVRIDDVLEGGDGVEFSMRFSTAPPPLWVRLQVLDYVGRSEPTDIIQFPVPLEIYLELAKTRVKLGTSLTPTVAASQHLLCAWIADGGGFPVMAARARVTLSAATAAGTVTQVRSLDVGRGKTTAVMLTWPRPTSVTARTEIEKIELSY
jgi:tetratricopeptide (TPR) repeat protein